MAIFDTESDPVKVKIKTLKSEEKLYCLAVTRVCGDYNHFLKEFDDLRRYVEEDL